MDNDMTRRGKPSTHVKFGESTAVLAGNSLLILAYEILASEFFKTNIQTKINLIQNISKCSGHLGIAGGQYLDLNYEHKKVSKKKITEMEIKKTGKLFSFCCVAPLLIKNKKNKEIKYFEKIGSEIGLLFQIADDLIDYVGQSSIAGKKTKKDQKQGKATLISLLGHKNAIKYSDNLIKKINKKINKYGSKSNDLNKTLDYILNRNK
jgi:farnesyl diphosphate synthase